MVAVATGGGFLLEGVANAQAAPPNFGTLTLTTFPTGTDLDSPQVRSSAGCSDPISTSFEVRIFGPIDGPQPNSVFGVDGFPVQANTSANFSKTDPINTQFSLDFFDAARKKGKVIIPGEYSLILNCLDDLSNIGGTFKGSVTFTDATHYTSAGASNPTPTESGTPTPTSTESGTPTPTASGAPTPTASGAPTPTPTASGTPTPTASAAPTPTVTLTTTAGTGGSGGTGTGSTGAGSGGGLAYTGAPVATIVTTGLALSALGIALLLAARRRRAG